MDAAEATLGCRAEAGGAPAVLAAEAPAEGPVTSVTTAEEGEARTEALGLSALARREGRPRLGRRERSAGVMHAEAGQFRVPRVLWARGQAEIRVVPNFVSDQEIAHLLALASWSKSTIKYMKYHPETGLPLHEREPQEGAGRTSSSCLLGPGQTAMVQELELRLAQLADSDVGCLEPLNLTRYHPGEFFKTHHDGGHRPVTVFLYLNDVPAGAGGETEFLRLGLRIRPQKGCAAIWRNTLPDGRRDDRLFHQGLPPVGVVKFGMNCFFRARDKPVR